jgi:hypothetical protein
LGADPFLHGSSPEDGFSGHGTEKIPPAPKKRGTHPLIYFCILAVLLLSIPYIWHLGIQEGTGNSHAGPQSGNVPGATPASAAYPTEKPADDGIPVVRNATTASPPTTLPRPSLTIHPSAGTTTDTIPSIPVLEKGEKTVRYTYTLRGVNGDLAVTVYAGVNDYLHAHEPPFYVGQIEEACQAVYDNPLQDTYLKEFFMKIWGSRSLTDDEARVAISLIQQMPYSIGSDDYAAQFPYETLYAGTGDCSQKSYLLAYVLKNLGYDVVLFGLPNHMAVGIRTDPQYDYMDTGYAFIETTQPAIITDTDCTEYPEIIPISGGNALADLSEEYNDVRELHRLQDSAVNNMLPRDSYHKWQGIVVKYGLDKGTTLGSW